MDIKTAAMEWVKGSAKQKEKSKKIGKHHQRR
jgi:hypothetical protein